MSKRTSHNGDHTARSQQEDALNVAWVGPGEPRMHFEDSFKVFNSLMLWTEQDCVVSDSIANHRWAREAYAAGHWPAVNDVVRLAILYEVGGWYCDATDVEWLKAPYKEPWFRPEFVIASWESVDWLNNGVLYAPKGDPWIKALLDKYVDKPFDPSTLTDNTGPCMLTRHWQESPRGVLTVDSFTLQGKSPTALEFVTTESTCARHHFFQTREEPK